MSFVRLRAFAPRLTLRAASSQPPTSPGSAPKSQPSSPPQRSSLDFLELLASDPTDSRYNTSWTRPGQKTSPNEGFSSEDDGLTRSLQRGELVQYYRLHVKSTNNNTLITLTDPEGNALKKGSASGGLVGFKGTHKSGYEAGYQCALRIFNRVIDLRSTINLAHGELAIELCLNGMFGQGREAVYRALMSPDGEQVRPLIRRITDTTRIRVGGTRPKKKRIL